MHRSLVTAALCALATLPAAAQQPAPARAADVKVAQAPADRCRKEVKDYVDTLRFVREAAGAQIGDKVAGGYIGEAELDRVIAAQGHCAAAQLLREKGTPR